MAEPRRRSSRTEGPVREAEASQPEVSPARSGYGTADHSFTLQAIMELQKTTGQLTSSINALTSAIEKTEKERDTSNNKIEARLDKLCDTMSGITHKLYGAGAVLVVVVAIGGFIANKAWDIMATRLTISISPIAEQQSSTPAGAEKKK